MFDCNKFNFFVTKKQVLKEKKLYIKVKVYNVTQKIDYSSNVLKKNTNPTFSANPIVVKNLSDKTLKMASLVATSFGLATLAIFQRNKANNEEVIKVYDLESNVPKVLDKPIITKPAQLSLFHMHDFHGQSERMERAYSASEDFQNGKLQKNQQRKKME